MASVIETLEEDRAELEVLLGQSKRTNVQNVLKAEIAQIDARLETERASLPPTAATTKSGNKGKEEAEEAEEEEEEEGGDRGEKSGGGGVVYEEVSKYAWDQGGKNVTMYLSNLEGIEEAEADGRVSVRFQEGRVSFVALGLGGDGRRNVKLEVELAEEILPSKCKLKVKAGGKARLILRKVDTKHWVSLKAKSSGLGAGGGPGKVDKEDPMGGIMDLMKNMYQEGDAKTKALIGEAWTKARDKQQ